MRPFSLEEAAEIAGARLTGPGELVFDAIRPLSRAGPRHLSFVTGRRYAAAARESAAGALIVAEVELASGRAAMVHPNPMLAVCRILEALEPDVVASPGVSPMASVAGDVQMGVGIAVSPGAYVSAGAWLGDRVVIGPGAFVGARARIDADTRLGPGAVIEHDCRVGSRCRIGPGAVVGFDGFGYVWDGERHRKIPQVGIVVIEDDVEIGANACVDRAALFETRIGRGTKIDNLVQVGHNVTVGSDSILCAQVGLAGSAEVGSGVVLAGQVGVADHAEIGDGAIVSAQSGILRRVEAKTIVSGSPAVSHADFLRRSAVIDRLPELLDRVRKLEAALDELKKGS